MPIEYRIEVEHEMARLIATGDIGENELWPALRDLLSDPAYRPDFSIMVDGSRVERSTMGDKEMRALATRLETFERERAGTRVGFLVEEGSVASRLVSTYVSLRSGGPYALQVFTDHDECEAFVRGTSPGS